MTLPHLRGRIFIVVALLVALVASSMAPALAVTTGSLTGTVTDQNGAPIPNVTVSAIAPTERHTATTDARGFYSITGMNSDTYTIAFSLTGYDTATVAGVTVYPDQQQVVNFVLSRTLRTIGRVGVRSTVGAFQPNQTLDQYSANPKKLEQLLGKAGATSESALVYSLPGAISAGNPSLRGGRTNQIGWTWEGITDIDPSTNQFGNSLLLNGIQTVSLTPGAGSASNATAGTGTVNLTIKRGANPAFGQVGFEADTQRFRHRMVAEYGFATPDNKFSQYISFIGTNTAQYTGSPGTPQALINNFYGSDNFTQRDIVSNTVFRFGRDNRQSFQIAIQDIVQRNTLDIGGVGSVFYNAYDPNDLVNLTGAGVGGLSPVQIQRLEPLLPNQPANTARLFYADTQIQPNAKVKFEYTNQINSSTYLAARLYRVNEIGTFDFPSFAQGAIYQLQGGYRSGLQLDITKQLNDKNLLNTGLAYQYERPLIDGLSNDNPYNAYNGLRGSGVEIFDFVKLQPGEKCGTRDASQCGYLYSQPRFAGASAIPLPIYDRVVNIDRGTYSIYVSDQFQATRRLKIEAGLRDDIASIKYPVSQPYSNPSVLQPRTAFSYQLSNNDAIRASYGRTVNFPQLSNIQSQVSRAPFTPFAGIPSYNVGACAVGQVVGTTCKPGVAMFCGTDGKTRCNDYADQLYWEQQLGFRGAAILQPLKPETFSNFDASYSHQFPHQVGLKITPFARRGFDVSASAQTPKLDANGQPVLNSQGVLQLNPAVATNLGIEKSTGVEFLLTKDAEYGFSGNLSATYVNELTNSIPLSNQENVFPTIPLPSILLGHVYRAGYITPFVSTATLQYQTHNGFRLNTQFQYNKGYPIGNGTLASIFLNNVPADVPLTDLTAALGARAGTSQFVDPSNPGSYTKPNVAARLGTPEGASPGGVLNNARITGTLTAEYTGKTTRNTVGLQVANLFSNLYARAARNTRIQPVATGVFGPATGNLNRNQIGPSLTSPDLVNYPDYAFRSQPYLIFPNNTPLTTTLYYYVKF